MKTQKANDKVWAGAPFVFALLVVAICPVSGAAQSNTFPSSGRVGIGTTNPQADLEVNGDIRYRNANTYNMTRTLSLTVNNAVNIGDFAFTNGAGSLRVSVTVPSGGYSASKEYFLPVSWGQAPNNSWATALPISSTGGYYGNDFALDIKVNLGTASLRLRTASSDGTYVGTAYIVVHQYGVNTDTFTASTDTGSASAPVWLYSGTTVTQVGFNAGIGTISPVTRLDVAGPIRAGSPLWCGGGVPNAQGAYFTWNQSCGTGETNFINHKGGGTGGFAFMNTTDGSSLSTLMFVAGSGNVGIGTASPGYKLDVAGSINTTGVNVNGSPITSSQWATTGTTINYGAGNVGIGTVGPGYKLDVQGGQVNASGGLCIAGDCKSAWSQVGGNSQWTTASSNIYYNAGNVGIGTISPAAKLHIVGGTDNPNTFLSLDTGVHGGSQFQIGGTTNNESYFNLNVYRAGLYSTRLSVNNFGHLLLQPSGDGNVGIGTTTPTTKLHVVGDGKVTGNLTVDGNIAAKYQDVAEWVPASETISAGTVVVLDSTKSNQVISCTHAYDTRVAGVISENPGIALGESGDHKVLVATTGRVRIKVDATFSPIHIGDLLVTSDISGMAMKSEPVNIGGVLIHRPGTLIGKALEPLAKGQGEILVLLSLQ